MLHSNVWSWKGYNIYADYNVDIAVVRGATAPKESLEGIPDAFLQIPCALEVGALAFRKPNGRPDFLIRDPDSPYGTRLHAVAGIVYEGMNTGKSWDLDYAEACGGCEGFLRVLASCSVPCIYRMWDFYEKPDPRQKWIWKWIEQGGGYLKKPLRTPMSEVQRLKATIALKTSDLHSKDYEIDETHLLFAMRNGKMESFAHHRSAHGAVEVTVRALLAGHKRAIDDLRTFLRHPNAHDVSDGLDYLEEVVQKMAEDNDDAECKDPSPEYRAAVTATIKEYLLLPLWKVQGMASSLNEIVTWLDDGNVTAAWKCINEELRCTGKRMPCEKEKPVSALVHILFDFSLTSFVPRTVVLACPHASDATANTVPLGNAAASLPLGVLPAEQFVTLLTHDPVLTSASFERVSRAMGEKARLASCTPGFFKTCALNTLPTIAKRYKKTLAGLRNSREYWEILSHQQGSRALAENWFWRQVFVRTLNETFATAGYFGECVFSARQIELAEAIAKGHVITSSSAFFDELWVFRAARDRAFSQAIGHICIEGQGRGIDREPVRVSREIIDMLPKNFGDLLQAQLENNHDTRLYKCLTVRLAQFCSIGGDVTLTPDFTNVSFNRKRNFFDVNGRVTPTITVDWQFTPEPPLFTGEYASSRLLVDFDKHLLPAVPWAQPR